MRSTSATKEAEEYFHRQIPITRAMGVRVVSCDQDQFIVEAPVALNFNHLRTAFGGSINAIATLAGYGLLWSALCDSDAHVVVAESTVHFLRPVHETIRAVCRRPRSEEWTAFRGRLVSTGKAAIRLEVAVIEQGETTAEFSGVFIARSGQISETPA